MTLLPFDPQRDEALGELLRAHLSSDDDAAFAARVRAAAGRIRRDTSWDVLARWARPGVAAAAGLAATIAIWLALSSAPAPAAEPLAMDEPAGRDVVMAVLLEGR
jgi:hypothetical protein